MWPTTEEPWKPGGLEIPTLEVICWAPVRQICHHNIKKTQWNLRPQSQGIVSVEWQHGVACEASWWFHSFISSYMAIVDHASAFSHSDTMLWHFSSPSHIVENMFNAACLLQDISYLNIRNPYTFPRPYNRSDLCFCHQKNPVRLFEGSLLWDTPLLRSLCATQVASVSHMHWPCMSCILSKTTGNHIKVSAVRNKTRILGVPQGSKLALNLETATVFSLFAKTIQNWQSLRTSCVVSFIKFHWYRIFKLLWTLTTPWPLVARWASAPWRHGRTWDPVARTDLQQQLCQLCRRWQHGRLQVWLWSFPKSAPSCLANSETMPWQST